VTARRVKFLTIKPTICTNFSNLFLEWNSTCFGQFLFPSSGVFHSTHSNGICHTCLLTACEQDQDGTAVPSWSCSQAVSKSVWHVLLPCVQRKIADDGQRNCPKHVKFHSKNKFEKLMHLVGFIIRKVAEMLFVCWPATLFCYIWSFLNGVDEDRVFWGVTSWRLLGTRCVGVVQCLHLLGLLGRRIGATLDYSILPPQTVTYHQDVSFLIQDASGLLQGS